MIVELSSQDWLLVIDSLEDQIAFIDDYLETSGKPEHFEATRVFREKVDNLLFRVKGLVAA